MTSPAAVPDEPPHVFVTVGTDVHPFDRVVRWVGRLARSEPELARWTVQRGHAAPVADVETSAFLDHQGLQSAMSTADLVVCHGGPSTITEARRLGRRPLVVPRSPEHGEHVDDHQLRFARRLGASGLVLLAEDEPTFQRLVRRALVDPTTVELAASEVQSAAASVDAFAAAVQGMLQRPRRRAGRS